MTEFCLMPSGLIVPERVAMKSMPARPKGLDLFSGAGGMSLGAILGGFEIVAAVEYDCISAMTYASNLCRYSNFTMHFITDADRERMERALAREYRRGGVKIKDGEIAADHKLVGKVSTAGSGWIRGQPLSIPGVSHLFIGDVRKLTADRILSSIGMKIGELDCVFGGPPCQGFSTSGKRNVYDPRNSLVFEFARMVCELKPKTMVMEEVPGILSMVTPEGIPVVEQLCAILEEGSFAGFEAFKAALKNSPGSTGVFRKRSRSKTDPSVKKEDSSQQDLFEGRAA